MFKVADDSSTRHTDQIICNQQSLCYYVPQVLIPFNRKAKKLSKNNFIIL